MQFIIIFVFFPKYRTEIIVISELGNPKLDAEEVFEEIVSLLHCYSMKLHSNRRKRVLEIRLTPNSI